MPVKEKMGAEQVDAPVLSLFFNGGKRQRVYTTRRKEDDD
jgi:hypothetical protein